MMKRILISVVLLSAALALAGCGPKGGGGESQKASASAVVTKSGVEMVALPGGPFTMGSDSGERDERPVHRVLLTAFLMDKYPVTGEMFQKAQLPNPSHWQESPKNPIEQIRWREAKAYCNERSRMEGLKPCYNEKTQEWVCDYSADGYRLPTEAEWEYAARAGSEELYGNGTKETLREYAWFADNSDQKTHPVGQKKPNGWGLYDMFGNVSAWCEDVYDPMSYLHSQVSDPTGPPSPGKDVKRVVRGGNWKASADMCRVTARQGVRTGDTDACFHTDFCGFRCVRRPTAVELAQMKAAKPAAN
jgi:formylglycine-generating enzyme required for sulfatase activity